MSPDDFKDRLVRQFRSPWLLPTTWWHLAGDTVRCVGRDFSIPWLPGPGKGWRSTVGRLGLQII
jgi:hypothetical protein